MNRLILFTALLGAIFLGVLGFWFYSDEELSLGAKAWLEQPVRAIPSEENLFHSVIGFAAAPGAEPSVAGKAMVDESNKAIDAFVARSREDEPKLPDTWNRQPNLESLRGVCSPSSEPCLETYRTQAIELRDLALQYQYLLSRYRGLAQYSDYQNTIIPSVHSPVPGFAPLAYSHRLRNALLTLDFLAGDRRKAVQTLLADMEFLRRVMASANTLIAKMIFASMLGHDIFLYGEWMDHANGDLFVLSELHALDSAAFEFEQIIRYEFLLNASSIDLVTSRPETMDIKGSGILLSLFGIKKNASMNLLYKGFHRELEVLESSPRELATHFAEDAEDEATWVDYVYNPVGTILYAISRPSLSSYGVRIHDLNGLITLVNAKRGILGAETASGDVGRFLADNAAKFPDPYTDGPLRWDAKSGLLTFESPAPDPKYSKLPMSLRR